MPRHPLTSLGLMLMTLWGCDARQPPEVRETDVFVDLQAPTTARRGQTVTVSLKTTGSDGCWKAPGATATVDEATRTVTFRARLEKPGQPLYGPGFGCPAAVVVLPVQASFVPASAGTYTLQVRIAPSYASDGTSAAVLEKLGLPAQNPRPGMGQPGRDLAWPVVVAD